MKVTLFRGGIFANIKKINKYLADNKINNIGAVCGMVLIETIEKEDEPKKEMVRNQGKLNRAEIRRIKKNEKKLKKEQKESSNE